MPDPVVPPVVDPNAVIPPVTVVDTPKDDTTKPDDKVTPPVVDPNAQPDPKDEGDKPKELDTNVWGDTGDETGNSVLQILQDSGVTPETAKALLYDAVKAGDVTKIDRDALVEKVGKANANLILAGIKTFVSEQQVKVQGVLTILHEEVGGKEQWDTMVAWAKENLSADEIDDYIAMVDQGGRKARMAAKDMRERYEEAGNTTPTRDKTVVPGNGKPTVTTIQPLTRAEYYKEVEALNKSGKATEQASNALWARRQAGINKGI